MRCVLRARGKPPSGYNVCDATHLALPRGTRTLALSRHLNQTSAVTSRSLPKQLSIAEEIWNEILEEEGKEKFVSNSIEISIGRKKPEPVEGLTTTGSKEAPSARRTKRLRKVTETPMKEPEVQGALKTPKSLLPRTKLARDIIENHVKFPHCILLTRVGQFYESYFDQAPEVAKLLNIKLAQRRWGIRGRIVDMAGFPLAHLDRHLKTLVQTEKRFVALCEEFRKPGAPPGPKRRFGPSPFERRVVRVVTPGTLIDESFVNPYDNNYVCAIVPGGAGLNDIGIAWMDVATGEFFTQLSNLAQLRDDLARINPREIVLEKFLKGPKHVDHPINRALVDSPVSIAYCDAPKELGATLLEMRASPVIVDNITNVLVSDAAAELDLEDEATASVFSPAETLAIQLISAFLQANLRENMPTLTTPVRFQEDARMQIDAHTVRALEIQKGSQGESNTGSLLSVVKRTITSSGSRLLSRWLCGPSTSVQEIQTRQALVALFYARPHLRRDMIALLRQTGDAIRLVQKMQLRRGDADDLLAIAETIGVHAHITSRLVLETRDTERVQENEDQFHSLELLLGRVSDLSQLAEKIGTAVHVTPLLMGETEAPPKVTPAVGFSDAPEDYVESKNWSIKHDFNPELRKLHKKLKKLKDEQEEMQYELQTEYSVPTLTLKIGVPHGIFVHVAKIRTYGSKLRTNEAFIPLSKSGSTESYFYKPWSQLGTAITECQAAILQAERDALESLRVVSCAVALRRNARIIDEIDVTVGFAELAAEMNFVRPVVNESLNFLTVNGRHPAVEIGLLTSGRVFTPNTVDLGPESRLMVITGPNMAGKSTVLRQSALIAILAQTGSFVPADYAEIGVVDRVFSRIGARDDLFHDRSTFMVEMLEAGEILRRATERSLVIMDEVGRGTTVRDGLAIAFATAHHIHSTNRCRAMFATHFHEVADMLGYYETEIEPVQRSPVRPSTKLFEPHCTRPHISFFCSDIASTGDSSTDEFTYSHRLQPGVNRESHGLRVARLGGMPDSAVEVARRVMERLRDGGPSRVTSSATQSVLQVGLGLGLGNREAMRKIGEDF